MKKQYYLTISFNIDGIDDPDARRKALVIYNKISEIIENDFDVKLKEIFDNDKPRKVRLF